MVSRNTFFEPQPDSASYPELISKLLSGLKPIFSSALSSIVAQPGMVLLSLLRRIVVELGSCFSLSDYHLFRFSSSCEGVWNSV